MLRRNQILSQDSESVATDESTNRRKELFTHRIWWKELDRFRIRRIFCLNKNSSDLNLVATIVHAITATKRILGSIVLRRRLPRVGLIFGRQLLVLRMIGKWRISRSQPTKSPMDIGCSFSMRLCARYWHRDLPSRAGSSTTTGPRSDKEMAGWGRRTDHRSTALCYCLLFSGLLRCFIVVYPSCYFKLLFGVSSCIWCAIKVWNWCTYFQHWIRLPFDFRESFADNGESNESWRRYVLSLSLLELVESKSERKRNIGVRTSSGWSNFKTSWRAWTQNKRRRRSPLSKHSQNAITPRHVSEYYWHDTPIHSQSFAAYSHTYFLG